MKKTFYTTVAAGIAVWVLTTYVLPRIFPSNSES